MSTEKNFTAKLLDSFNEIAVQKTISKGDFLIREGEIERNVYLVESGAIRVFYLSEFEDQTIRFGYEDSLINSLSSFIKGTPSEFFIEAIRKTKLKIIPKEKLLQLVYEMKTARNSTSSF